MAQRGQRPSKTKPYRPTPEQRRGDKLVAKLDRILARQNRWMARNLPKIRAEARATRALLRRPR